MTEMLTDDATINRWIDFEAGFNFRDLGGYPTRDGRAVRWGRLFRADTLHRLSAADLVMLRVLGLRTVVDLRAASEIDDFGRLHPDACRTLDWHHVPMIDVVHLRASDRPAASDPTPPTQPPPGEHYVQLISGGDAVTRVLSLLARDGGLPAVFHCTAGRDRTGMVAAMVLDILGVADEVIADDYALTNLARPRSDEWIQRHEPTFAAYLAQFPADQRVTRPEVILGFLAGIRSAHGSVEGFLRAGGVTAAELEGLRDQLLD